MPPQTVKKIKPRLEQVPYFRILYNSTFTFFILILLVLLIITPADHIYQILKNDKVGNVFVIAATYLVTAIVAIFVYTSRLYTNRATMIAIPRPYLPITKGEVNTKIHRLIVKNRQRSALIAWDSRPRDIRLELQHKEEQDLVQRPSSKRGLAFGKTPIPLSATAPTWGHIDNPGWSPPHSEDLPGVQFQQVLRELPSIIEAKAVSLAPADPTYDFMSEFRDTVAPPPDPRAVALLQRPRHVGLREYLGQLDELGMFTLGTPLSLFLELYESARFSAKPVLESHFRRVMTAFSDILTRMQKFDKQILQTLNQIDTMSLLSQDDRSAPSVSYSVRDVDAMSEYAASMESSGSVVHHSPT